MEFRFHVLRVPSERDPEGDFFLLGSLPDHISPMIAINTYAGGEVVRLNGNGFGVNLKIVNKDLWSEKIAPLTDAGETANTGVITIPEEG